jgi:hypothetical protein
MCIAMRHAVPREATRNAAEAAPELRTRADKGKRCSSSVCTGPVDGRRLALAS